MVDLDAVVEAGGRPIAQIFSEDGEAAFRELERRALLAAVDGPPAVVVGGGGALLSPEARQAARSAGTVACLVVGPETAADRCRGSGRPLLSGDPVARLTALLEARAAAYATADVRVETDGLTPHEVAERLAGTLRGGRSLDVALSAARYTVELRTEDAFERVEERASRYRRRVVVSDRRVASLYGEALARRLGAQLVVFPGGERTKTPSTVTALHRAFASETLGRRDLVVALGGGIVGDVAGYAASTWLRGVDVLQVPTTLLAQVDSSVGGKTGVNLDRVKNAVGTFHHPVGVIAPLHTLETLPRRQLRAGLAELVKHGFIADPGLVAACRRVRSGAPLELLDLIRSSVEVKRRIVVEDEREQHRRKVLNFGHTFGHAIEAESRGRVLHGEAVALGMVLECRLGVALGITPKAVAEEVTETLRALGLPHRPDDWLARDLGRWLVADKKRVHDVIDVALPTRIGVVDYFPVPLDTIGLFARGADLRTASGATGIAPRMGS